MLPGEKPSYWCYMMTGEFRNIVISHICHYIKKSKDFNCFIKEILVAKLINYILFKYYFYMTFHMRGEKGLQKIIMRHMGAWRVKDQIERRHMVCEQPLITVLCCLSAVRWLV